MKKYKKIVWLLVLIVIIFFSLKFWWNTQLLAVSSDQTSIVFVVDKGESFSQVVSDLKKAKLIKSTYVFNILAKQSNLISKVQAGTFRLSPSQTSREILKILTEQPLDNWVTLIEGWRVEEMAQKLGDEFLKYAKEGYMFPDTYLFPKDYTGEQIAKKLRDTFDLKYSLELKSKIKAQGLTESQGVILASLVEREGRSDEVRTKVAGIILKRFKMGMKLDIDATVQYAKDTQTIKSGKKLDKFWMPITRDNYTDIISPYNTYLNNGLPPTPICNPSLASLTAVANADSSTPYLYYFHDLAGNSYYGKTLEEHNANVVNHR